MKNIIKKWWFWVIIVVIIGGIGMSGTTSEDEKENKNYKTKYEWSLKEAKKNIILQTNDEYKYVVLEIENKDNDLESGEYEVKTNDNLQASFMVYLTDNYYENDQDIPMDYYKGMVQGSDRSTLSLQLNKGQYLYLCQNKNGQGKVIVTKK